MAVPVLWSGSGVWLALLLLLSCRVGGASTDRNAIVRGRDVVAVSLASLPIEHDADPTDDLVFLYIGVKTSVLHHVPQRRAIRETWANASLLRSANTRVVFLGCAPDLSTFTDPVERARVDTAIATEKQEHGDLLTTELDCVDSYARLLHKVVRFTHWLTTRSIVSLQYAMVVDDDVYLDVDRLVDWLRRPSIPQHRFYGGHVFTNLTPVRDPAHKNYISERDFPSATLPPFASGPHYVVSMDIVAYVAQHGADLRTLSALDDVTMAFWLQQRQIHPVHIPQFALLRKAPCADDAVALADLSSSAMYHVHRNVVDKRRLCAGLDAALALRHHRSIVLPRTDDADDNDTLLTWKLVHNATSYALQIHVTITVAYRDVRYLFVPSAVSYEHGLCLPAATLLLAELYVAVDAAFCEFHRQRLLAFLDQTIADDVHLHAMLTLARHNLAVDLRDAAVTTVVLSPAARYARILLECLLVDMYPPNRIFVHTDAPRNDVLPDIVVFSILDDDTSNGALITARYATTYGRHPRLLMLSGEAWPLRESLDPRVTLLSTLAPVVDYDRRGQRHAKHVYLPVASTAFAEMVQHTPLELLRPYGHPDVRTSLSPRRFCAYLYARCDRLPREYFFDLLNDIEPVDALGACQGLQREPRPARRTERYNDPFYTDAAIATYTNYKFVVAFENTLVPGYVTEKIVTAFLAGAVPIYYGHAPTVTRLFNPDAFINCANETTLRACVQRVLAVHASPVAYEAMRRAPPIVNHTVFDETFGWHPAVAAMASQLQRSRVSEQLRRFLESNDVA